MHFKKFLFILFTVFCCELFCSSVFADQSGDFTYTVSNNQITITGYTGTGGAVVIPGTINSMPIISIGFAAFIYKTSITDITIPGSVASIEGEAFRYCAGLTSVTIPGSVTNIGAYAFADCIGFTSLTIPSSLWIIGDFAFYGCTGLTSIDIAASNPNYSSQDGVLYNKTKTTLMQYPSSKNGAEFIIPGSVTSIEISAFNYSAGLTSVTIPSSVTNIGNGAFYYCTGLTSITIPKNVTSIGDAAFYCCTSLSSAYFEGNAPLMGSDVFFNCAGSFTVYYAFGSKGFTNPWQGYPTAPDMRCPAKQVLGADNPKLDNLRAFRDSILAQSAIGRKMIQIYYNNSEPVRKVIFLTLEPADAASS